MLAELHAYYGKSHILQGVDLSDRRGRDRSPVGAQRGRSIDDLQGDHGTGAARRASQLQGPAIAGLRADRSPTSALATCRRTGRSFPTLTVRQNLELGLKRAGKFGRWTFDDMFRLFPNLGERQHNQAGVLSGGEQQMLTMCRTLMGDPDLVIIDEPTEGLAPKLVEQVGRCSTRSPGAASRSCWSSRSSHRAEDLAAALRHGPRPHRLRGHARRARRRCRHPQGMARSLIPKEDRQSWSRNLHAGITRPRGCRRGQVVG